jgi:hypothetical protein
MKRDLVVIVPSRGRPNNARALAGALGDTCTAYTRAVFAIDDDDPTREFYDVPVTMCGAWQPMVSKLNKVAIHIASGKDAPFAMAFLGDDHRPRTTGWDTSVLAALRKLRTGVVYGDDLIEHANLASSWVMTSDIVRALGRMVPAPVEHMFCDNAVMDLARAAGCLRYLPNVVIEHCHPLVHKASWDPGYWRVNQPAQYARDRATYRTWQSIQFDDDVRTVKELREARHVGAVRNRQ